MSGLFDSFKRGLEKTKTALLRTFSSVFSDTKSWDSTTYINLEKALIATDLGANISKELVSEMKDAYERGKISTGEDVIAVAKNRILSILAEGAPAVLNRPYPRRSRSSPRPRS